MQTLTNEQVIKIKSQAIQSGKFSIEDYTGKIHYVKASSDMYGFAVIKYNGWLYYIRVIDGAYKAYRKDGNYLVGEKGDVFTVQELNKVRTCGFMRCTSPVINTSKQQVVVKGRLDYSTYILVKGYVSDENGNKVVFVDSFGKEHRLKFSKGKTDFLCFKYKSNTYYVSQDRTGKFSAYIYNDNKLICCQDGYEYDINSVTAYDGFQLYSLISAMR